MSSLSTFSFSTRAESMNLSEVRTNIFQYTDVHGSVEYRKLETVDREEIPFYGIYTKSSEEESNDDFSFKGIVSDKYQFVGNEIINQSIRDSVSEVGAPIFKEITHINQHRTRMYNEIIIQNEKNIPETGDVYPQIIIENSYDGTKCVTISFGLSIIGDDDERIGFGFKNSLGHYNQRHKLNSTASLVDALGQYINVFSGGIGDIISSNFNAPVTEQMFMKTLSLVEEVGSRRKTQFSSFISDLTDNTMQINTWQLFVALTRFSTSQKNLNARLLLESVAERVLILPTEIKDALKQINIGKTIND